MVQHSRKPATAILLLVALLGAWLAFSGRSSGAGAVDDAELTALQIAIGQPDAKSSDWIRYASKLQQFKRYAYAAAAYRKALESEPYNREVRLQAATCLALAGKPDEFLAFMTDMVLKDPKLAVDVFERPESQKYLADERFQAVAKEARIQSMD